MTPTTPARTAPDRARLIDFALKVVSAGPVVVLAVTILVFWALTPFFLTASNLSNVLIQSSVVAVLAMGIFVVVLVGSLDLSVGATVGAATVLGGVIFRDHPELGGWVIPIMLASGLVAGVLNALLIIVFRIGNSFIVTLGTLYVIQSFSFVAAGGSQVSGMPDSVTGIANGSVLGVPGPIVVTAVCAVVLGLVMSNLAWGRWLYAIGGNAGAAERMGIPVRRVMISVFVTAGLFAGIAAVLVAGRADAGYPDRGNNILLAIAAVVIGGASLSGGRGSVFGTVVGALTLGAMTNGLTLLSVEPNWVPFAVGAVLVAAVGLDAARGRLERTLKLRQAQLQGEAASS